MQHGSLTSRNTTRSGYFEAYLEKDELGLDESKLVFAEKCPGCGQYAVAKQWDQPIPGCSDEFTVRAMDCEHCGYSHSNQFDYDPS
ncbi:hypothetical protein [Halomonas sp. I5-271120]|uniref:hypothetical protein n=1 Tax=Halomonas sp. I5-271120 TaxID=3061632 RepID=UPI0027151FFD|nr:hypothetical protein [Halomonas sp. I5-271120]